MDPKRRARYWLNSVCRGVSAYAAEVCAAGLQMCSAVHLRCRNPIIVQKARVIRSHTGKLDQPDAQHANNSGAGAAETGPAWEKGEG